MLYAGPPAYAGCAMGNGAEQGSAARMSESVTPSMQSTLDQSEGRSEAAASRVERRCAIALAGIALLTLFIWKLSPALAALPDDMGLMHPSTALGMLLAALAIECSGPTAPAWRSRVMHVCAGFVVLLALFSLSEVSSAGHRSLGDWWVPGHSAMSPQSGAGLLLLGLTLPLTRIYRGPLSVAADVLTLLLVDFMLVMLMGYVFSISSLFGEVGGIRIPPPSFLCFLVGTAVVIQRRGHGGMLAVLRGDRIGSRIVRVAIPLALALPLLLSLVRAYVVSTGLLSAVYASAASISFICLCVTLLTLLMGWRINGLERDVRELMQKHSDAQLQESERRYMDLVEQSISGFVVRRADGQLILVNEAYRKMTGYSREELLSLKAKDLVVDQGVIVRVQKLQPGESTHIETFLKRKDGSLLEVEYVTQKLQDGNLQTVILDISHRKQLQKQRDESERRYGELVDQALEGIMVRRPNGSIVFVNDTFCRMLDLPRERLLQLNIKDLVHPDDAETIEQIQQLGHGGHLRLNKRMLRKDGRVIYVAVSAKRLRNGDIQTTVQDVSELRHAELRFRTMVEGAPNAMIMADEGGRITLANPQAEKLFGYGSGELMGRSVDALVPLRFRDAHLARRASFAGEQRARNMGVGRDLYGLRKDGSEVPVEIGLNPITSGDQRLVLASIIDITERKRLEQSQRESEQRYQDLVEQAADAIWLRAADGRMVFVNDAACRLLGYTREELLESRADQLVHASDPGTSSTLDALRPLETLRIERFVRHKDGHPVPVEASCHRLTDGSMQVISHDITERRRSAAELQEMSRRLGAAQETERRAIARELHDEVGQSLTATRINLRDLGQQAVDSPLQQRLADTEGIIAELLGKVRQMSLDLHPSVLDDLGLVPALRWCVRTRTTGSPMQVEMDLPEDLPRFDDMAEITLFRVFQEALSNALKHAEAPHLQVSLHYGDGRLDLSLKDDGKGFDAEAARRAALSGKSLGVLGMQERVRLAGGEFMMESAPGKGAEVRVSLPGEER